MQARQTMKIDVSVLIGGSFHTLHICPKEDREMIAGGHVTIEISKPIKAEAK
jgi:hypothetical protein